MTKNHIKQFLKKLTHIKTWQLLLILIPLLFITATLLRFDHLGMTTRLSAVLAADEKGDDAAIATALSDLKSFTFTHITINIIEKNGTQSLIFGTGPFYLQQQYIKKATAELEKAKSALSDDANPNGNVFQKATDVCDPLAKQYRWGYSKPYFDCILTELDKYPASTAIVDFQQALIPPTALYRHDYASPIWYPTLAGFSILLSLILIVVIFTRLLIYTALRIILFFMKNR
jgi:hypothetical protein